MSALLEEAVQMRGLAHSARDCELRIEARFDPGARGFQAEALEAIAKMTNVVTGSIKYHGHILKLRIDIGNTPKWQILEKLDRAEQEVFKTVKAIAKRYSRTPARTTTTDTTESTSPPELTLINGSRQSKPRYVNQPGTHRGKK